MAVNIDEGEPGTFKDRVYLERDPHRFLEGMLIAAWAVGIAGIYIYLRDEYHGCRALLERELARLRAEPALPALPMIELRRGAGAYICGEESAMIESIEGKRGMPRLRPPYVAQVGLFGRPTLEHNFETLYWVRDLVEKGVDWFTSEGRHGRKGLRSFSVSGRVKKPGVKLAPAGITVAGADRRILRRHARWPRVVRLPAGRRFGRHPARGHERPPAGLRHAPALRLLHRLGRDHRAVGQGQRPSTAARNLMRFFRDESCGQCTPCRVGTAKALVLIEQPQLGPAAAGGVVAGRCATRRSAAWGRRRPTRSIACQVFPPRAGLTPLPVPGKGGGERRGSRNMNAVTRHELAQLDAPLVSFKLDGRDVTGRADETIIQVADREGIEIPRLCYKDGLDAVGNCRACMVEIKGERVLAPSLLPQPGQRHGGDSKSERAWRRRRWCWNCCSRTCPRPVHALQRGRSMGREIESRQTPFRTRAIR